MRRLASPFGATWWLILLLTCPAQAQLVNQVVAVVGQEVITLAEVDQEIADQLAVLKSRYQGQELKEKINQLREKALDELINTHLAEIEAKRLGVVVQESEVDQAIEEVLKNNRLSRQELERNLAREGITWQRYRAKVRIRILASRLVYKELKPKILIPEEEKRRLYESRKDQYAAVVEVTLGRIVLPATNRDLIEKIETELRQGADFTALAERYSQGPEAKDGGLIGAFKLDQLSDKIKKAVADLEQGGISQPVEAGPNLQIFKLIKKKVIAGQTFKELEGQLTEELQQKALAAKFDEWIKQVRERSYVKIMKIED